MSLWRTRFDTGCTIEVEHSDAHLHAHVELDGDVEIGPGDQVRVHGAAIRVPFGERIVERRIATVARANMFERAWTRIKGDLDLTEMYEITFSSGARL
jgi:hypothetical protein